MGLYVHGMWAVEMCMELPWFRIGTTAPKGKSKSLISCFLDFALIFNA